MTVGLSALFSPRWLFLVVFSTLVAAFAAFSLGLQAPSQHTSTTFIYGRRVGHVDRQLATLDEHLDDIVNAVEFPQVFEAVEAKTGLKLEKQYDFTIERIDDIQSVIEITVVADQPADAERVARIMAEEVVRFVLDGQEASLVSEIASLDASIADLEAEQGRLRALSLGVSPIVAQNRVERALLNLDRTAPDAAAREASLRLDLANIRPQADEYIQNASSLGDLQAERAVTDNERLDVVSSLDSINDEWYRSVTPVEATSNLPIAIAMAFAAGVPAAIIASVLVIMRLNQRMTGRLFGAPPTRDNLAV
ncbi:MAG: hypothetical protein HKN94_17190 [Acidimicrobiales bacterium]|nr:hypothetical protein [Acidimicrobiales bacterium]RZV48530.1 MAG: hypothetical protein EX269_01280 [Acidimicrobiales bacterium]